MLATHKGEIPFVVFILPFLAGVALALSFNLSAYQTTLSILFTGFLIAFIGLNLFYQRFKLYRRQWISGAMLHLLLLISGVLVAVNYDSRNQQTYFANYPADKLLMKVSNEPQLKNGYLRFTADAEACTDKKAKRAISGALMITMRADTAHLVNYGDELLIPAKYNPVDPPFNPAEFNYKAYLSHQNIYEQAFVDAADVVVVNKAAGNPVIAYSLKLRQRLVGQFKVYMHNTEAISVASTLILGYKAELDNDILQAYSKTGTIHVLSVSGAHVAIIFMMIGWLLGFMDRWKYGRVLKAVISITLICYYSLLTGFSPAVCRAAVMISLIIIGNTYNRQINTLNILAASAFGILLFNPFLITDVGFQLSYLAVGGLIVFQPVVYSWLDIENKWLDKLWLLCSASIAAQAITFPLSAYYFHQFPVYFLLSNLLIIVPVEVIMYAGIICLSFAQMSISVLAKLAGYILEKSILLMDWFLKIIEYSPYASAGKIWLTQLEYLLLFAVILLAFCWFYYKRSGLLKTALACTLVLCISLSAKRIAEVRSNTITFYNLKKHPAILFKQGSNAVLLTDLTDTDKVYKYSVQPGLDSAMVNHLTIVSLAKDTATTFWAKRGSLVRFMGKKVLIMNKAFSPGRATDLNIDYLFLTDNPYGGLTAIREGINYQELISDAGNSDKFLDILKENTLKGGKKIYLLKRNKSLVLPSE